MDENFAAFLNSGKDKYLEDLSHFAPFDYCIDGVTSKDLNFIYITDKDTLETMNFVVNEQSQRNIENDQENQLLIEREPISNSDVLDMKQTEDLQKTQKSIQELNFLTYELKNFNNEERKNLVFYSRPMALLISNYFPHFKTVKRVIFKNQDSLQYEIYLQYTNCLFLDDKYINNNKIGQNDIQKCYVQFKISQYLGAQDLFQLFQSYMISNLRVDKDKVGKKLYIVEQIDQSQILNGIDLSKKLIGYELDKENISNLKMENKFFVFLTQTAFQQLDNYITLKDIKSIQKMTNYELAQIELNQEPQITSNDSSDTLYSGPEEDDSIFLIQCFNCKNELKDIEKRPFCVCGKIYCDKYCRNKRRGHSCKNLKCANCKKLLAIDELYCMKMTMCGDIYCEEDCLENDKQSHILSCKVCGTHNQQQNRKSSNSNKPKYELGIVGLQNIGNTCYMNSALQCVFHTRIFQNIFFKTDLSKMINKENPLGSNGILISSFQKVFEQYWNQENRVLYLREFKYLIEKYMPAFEGYDQHDSQEFFSQLLDNFHEDLNLIKKKPFVENIEGNFGDNEVQLARQSWMNFLKRNLSVFVNYFYGQFRSLVECNQCDKKSLTFDPFCVLTLDIPKKTQKIFNLYHIPKDHLRQIQRYHFKSTSCNMFKEVFIGEIKNYFCQFLKMNKDDFVICFLGREREGQVMQNRDSLFNFYERTQLFRIRPELFIYELNEEEKILRKQKSTMLKFLKYSHEEFDVTQEERDTIQFFRMQRLSDIHEDYAFNKPLYLKQNITNKELHALAFRKLFPTLDDLKQKYANVNKTQKFYTQLFENLLEQDEKLFYLKYKNQIIPYDDQKFNECFDVNNDNDFVYLYVTNKKDLKQEVNMDNFLSCCQGDQDDYPVFIKQDSDQFKSECSIYDLLTKFQIKEQLDSQNTWYCKQCKEHVLAYKTLNIYKAPEYLVVLLKKVKNYKDDFSSVTFPIDELDLSKYLDNSESVLNYNVQLQEVMPEEEYEQLDKDIKVLNLPPKISTKYKLYGVVNHYGTQLFGHYTAYCYLESKNKWINFDDSSVNEIQKENVVSDNAYLLFYRKIDELECLDQLNNQNF